MRKAFGVIVVLCLFFMTLPVWGSDFNALEFARTEVLVSAHPTANGDDAVATLDKAPVKDGDLTVTRVLVNYSGWRKQHRMILNVYELDTQVGKLVRAEILEDSNSIATGELLRIKYLNGAWYEFEKK